MRDNLLQLKSSLRSKLFNLKRKVNSLNTSLEGLYMEIDLIDRAFEKIDVQLELYKSRVHREAESEVRRLRRELEQLEKQKTTESVDTDVFKQIIIASTVTIFDSIVYAICRNNHDILSASYAALFPLIYSHLLDEDEGLLLEHMPDSAMEVVNDARNEFNEIRKAFDGDLTEPQNWDEASEFVFDYWRDVALPKLYGKTDPRWSGDSAFSLTEMLTWNESESERVNINSKICDVYLIKDVHQEEIIDHNGVVTFNRMLMPSA